MLKAIALFILLMIGNILPSFAETKITYYHYDLLGSPVATTNEAGAVTWRERYEPWGKKTLNNDAVIDNVRDYTGHVHDKDTGLTYMQARYYDPEIGRFMGIDPVGFQESNPMMFNRYAYANNNPYKFTDPNGEVAETIWDVANIGMGVVSLGSNINDGSWGWAVLDVVGIVADSAATALPFIPGGAGAGIKALRAGDKVKDGNKVKRRTQNKDDVTRPSERAARRQAFRENNVPTSKANNFERVEVHGKNDNLKGPNGEPSELIRTQDVNGNKVEIKHHNNGHSYPDGTSERSHYHGNDTNHISYGEDLND